MYIDASKTVLQPPLLPRFTRTLTVIVAGLALGGAERIVLDWISRIDRRWRVHLVILREHDHTWLMPDNVVTTHLHGQNVKASLQLIGISLAASNNPLVLTHLLSNREQKALRDSGAIVKQVFHNARNGWLEQIEDFDLDRPAIAVSHAAREDLRVDGWRGDISVIHHLPRPRRFLSGVREYWRRQWKIPSEAFVIGMIGATKPQKNYQHALRILRAMHDRGEKAYLVIVGGPIGSHGEDEWREIRDMVEALGLRWYVSMPGFVFDAIKCLPAFDVMLNTSHYEGLSIATLEVLANACNMVASKVGGQGEVTHTGLYLVDKTAPLKTWVDTIVQARDDDVSTPFWVNFPAYRLWTTAHLAHDYEPNNRVLFVTANLNAGGAQRSLVNMTTGLSDKDSFEIVVTGNSTADDFHRQLFEAGVSVSRTDETNDVFVHAESLLEHIMEKQFGTVCFWNVDPKVKLLLAKQLQHTRARLIDVSPGGYSFEELHNTTGFIERVCFTPEEFYKRLNSLVLKFSGGVPELYDGDTRVIRNGIPDTEIVKTTYGIEDSPRILVCGRLAPTKYLEEILEAMQLVRKTMPAVELHVYGVAEPRCRAYAQSLQEKADDQTYFHGAHYNVQSIMNEFDAFVVLGKNQGCPNALLEALSVGLPSVANDDGGTREQLIHEETGLLTADTDPKEVAAALLRLLTNRDLAARLGSAGRAHVLHQFSMREMVEKYTELFWDDNVLERTSKLSHIGS